MTANVDRTVGKILGAVVGTTCCCATFFVQLMVAVALTRPDVVSGSRAPGIVLNLLFGIVAIAVGIAVGRALFRRLAG
jgi:hypothetical protein